MNLAKDISWIKYGAVLISGILLLVLFRTEITGYVVNKGVDTDKRGDDSGVIFDNGSVDVVFCPSAECEHIFVDAFENADYTIYCAFYELDDEKLIDVLADKSSEIDVRLVVDEENVEDAFFGEGIVLEKSSAFMHNKFCIVDNTFVITGSANPTNNGFFKNNNNIIIIYSSYIVENYLNEFAELWHEDFGKGKTVSNAQIIIVNNNNTTINTYFCPDDSCENKVLNILEKTEKSIYFMTYSFTSPKMGNTLLAKGNNTGTDVYVEIKGVFENLGSGSQYSQFSKLYDHGFDVRKDTNPSMMHHKVFIVDSRIVITGSYNPTDRGNKVNDENILIIDDREIAQQYITEFNRIFDASV